MTARMRLVFFLEQAFKFLDIRWASVVQAILHASVVSKARPILDKPSRSLLWSRARMQEKLVTVSMVYD